MNNLGLTINNFQPESGWADIVWGKSLRYGRDAASLKRFNTELRLDEESGTLTTKNGRRSVYINLDTPISTGKAEISFKINTPSRGVGFLLSCGTDSRCPVEVACNRELNDTVLLNIDIRNQEVRYCSALPNKDDANIIRFLTDNVFEYGKWYDVKFVLDYDKYNASMSKSTEEWIHFSMTDEDGTALVDTDISHLSQCVSVALSQFRIVVKEGTLIKDFSIQTEGTVAKKRSARAMSAAVKTVDLLPVIAETAEDIPVASDENIISDLAGRVIVGDSGVIVPKYAVISDGITIPVKDYDELIARRKNLYASKMLSYRGAQTHKLFDTDKLVPYKYAVYNTDVNNIVTTNDFADMDYLMNEGYRCVYIGYEGAQREYPTIYGTYEGRSTHVIPENDYNRCHLVCNDDNASEIINIALSMYEGEPLVITFMDGDYKLDILGGDGSAENPYTCIKLNRDNVIFRTFDYNTNFTLKDKSQLIDGDCLKVFDIGKHENISVVGFNYFLEDMPPFAEVYKYPGVNERVQKVIDYVNTREEYPGINTVSGWIHNGLPSEIIENMQLKETNAALEAAVLELAEMVSEVVQNG